VKRLFIFAHFDRDHIVDPHVVRYVSALSRLGNVSFISTSSLSPAEIAKIQPFTVRAVCRADIGRDFMSWQLGLKLLQDPTRYDEIVICNDSVYAPIFPLDEMFDAMRGCRAAYWGVTTNCEVARHIQSHFIVFRRPVLEEQEFWRFWDKVRPQPNKRTIIETYEIGLSLLVERLGFSGATYFPTEDHLNKALATFKWPAVLPIVSSLYAVNTTLNVGTLVTGAYNKTLILWKELLLSRVPMIKVELLRDNPKAQPLDDVFATLERYSQYPVQIIKNHLRRIHSIPVRRKSLSMN
jgi:lipopolysaccharide biosynthesis protein